MREKCIFLAIVCGIFVSFIAPANACEDFASLSNEDIKTFRDKLIDKEADPLDQLFAFEELACSDNPTIRNYAIRQGLDAAGNPLVRHEILLTAFMQMTRVDVELGRVKGLKKYDLRFIDEHSGVYSVDVTYRDRESGCLGFITDRCHANESMFVKGGTVEFNSGSIKGLFRLTEQNELVGYLRPKASKRYSNIPAVIRLF